MQNGEVDRPFALGLPPVIDGCGNGSGLGLLPGTAVERIRATWCRTVPSVTPRRRAMWLFVVPHDVRVLMVMRASRSSRLILASAPETVRKLDLNRRGQLVNLAVA